MLGWISGIGVLIFLTYSKVDGIKKVVLLLCFSFVLLEIETRLKEIIPISALLAIMTMGMCIKKKDKTLATYLSYHYNKLWDVAEIFLFELVGCCINVQYAIKAGIAVVLLVVGALLFRVIGVLLSLIKTKLTKKEKLFCTISYLPKATI